jgi:hypothetical protein
VWSIFFRKLSAAAEARGVWVWLGVLRILNRVLVVLCTAYTPRTPPLSSLFHLHLCDRSFEAESAKQLPAPHHPQSTPSRRHHLAPPFFSSKAAFPPPPSLNLPIFKFNELRTCTRRRRRPRAAW